MRYDEGDYLLLSGLQHFAFCRRQWALIHIEKQWEENVKTVEGNLLHRNAHDSSYQESRGDVQIFRGVSVSSPTLGISGECDVLEYHKSDDGIPLPGKEGLWQPYPIEYKRGHPKENDADRLQLCAQALCLEEMLCCPIPEGALFYGEIRRRESIVFTDELRTQVRKLLEEMHDLYQRGYTPKVKPGKFCNACSLQEICLPKLARVKSVSSYLAAAMEEDT